MVLSATQWAWRLLDGASDAPQQNVLCAWVLFRCDEAMAEAKRSVPTFRRSEVSRQSTINLLPAEEEKPVLEQHPMAITPLGESSTLQNFQRHHHSGHELRAVPTKWWQNPNICQTCCGMSGVNAHGKARRRYSPWQAVIEPYIHYHSKTSAKA